MQTAAAMRHYETHLAPIYSWMLGDIEAAFARSAAELEELRLPPAAAALAVDLGAGLGLHAAALANRGFSVTAIDSSEVLLDELRSRCAALPIVAINADLEDFQDFVQRQPAVIVCMGDTLTHLPSFAAVEKLLAAVAVSLAPGGVFAATFRDYASKALEGNQRFILVRADQRRILTCFLEYRQDFVTVHDVLTEQQDGAWQQRVSNYPKLRLAPEWVAAKLVAHGLKIRRDATQSGMVRIVGVKT
ncbi:MAG TPA: class I SAM-dependent methyltransferase [Steroidobacteraceae bacterium]|nr:class I SAM-dependent methyltransferase [Steroidobacteraceae bacterium]